MQEYQLSSGITLSEQDLDEVRQIVHRLDDIEDVRGFLTAGLYDDLLFGDIPESELPKIAQKKAYHERQQEMPWNDAADLSISEWAESEHARLLVVLKVAYISKTGDEVGTEEFENAPELFRNQQIAQELLSEEDYAIWQAVVPAAGNEEKGQNEEDD